MKALGAASPSRLQREVTAILTMLGARPEQEVIVTEGYSVDAVVHWEGVQLAVEVDATLPFSEVVPRTPLCAERCVYDTGLR